MNIPIPKNWKEFKQHLNEPLFKNTYFLMINRITGAGAGFFFWLLATRFYTPQEFGLATAIIVAMNLVILFSLFGFNFGIIGYLSNENDKTGLINSCFTITSISSLLLALTFVVGIDFWSPALAIIKENAAFLICFILFTIADSPIYGEGINPKGLWIESEMTLLRNINSSYSGRIVADEQTGGRPFRTYLKRKKCTIT